MRVYVDIDDVLCETAASLCILAEREFGRKVAYKDVGDFDLKAVFGLSDGEMERFRELSHRREVLLSFPATPGAVDGVLALKSAGHLVDIVTGRPAYTHHDTSDWLRAAGLGDFPVTYVDKYGRTFKSGPDDPPTVSLSEIEARGYDIAIDDSPVVLKLLAHWRETKVLVFARPWNRRFSLAANMTRAADWTEILSSIQSARSPFASGC